MSKQWSSIKGIIEGYAQKKNLYLSVINEKGKIVCANSTMKRNLQLPCLKQKETNLLDLIHPLHLDDFRKAIASTASTGHPSSLELYLKNGYYHPMKWQVNYLENASSEGSFFCVGHKILEDQRLREFNQLGQKNYQLIVEGLNTGVIFQDKDGEVIAANQKVAEIFDVSLEKLYQLKNIGRAWNELWHIRTEEGAVVLFKDTPFMKAIATGEPHIEILVIRLISGEYRWIQFNSQPLFNEACSQPYAVVSNIVNITDEKILSGKLQERDAIFNEFMQQTPNLAWVVDDETRLVFGSSSFFKYFHLDRQQSMQKKIVDLVPAAVSEALYAKHLEVLKTGKAVEMMEKAKWADGTSFIFHINIFPIEGITNKRMIGGHAVNLSDKYAIEKKLRETNDRLLMLTRATTDAIWEWDLQTGHIFRNDALMDMIGYQLDDPKGLSWWLRRIHPEDRNRVSDKVKDSTEKSSQSWEDEYRFKCADGTYKHMRDKGYIVYENGLPVKMIGSLQDVTNLKELENRLLEEQLLRQKDLSETVIRVQEKERTRIGHELHDNVNQILGTTKLFVDMLTPADKDEKILKEKSLSYLLMAIEEIRKLSKELVVPQLKDKSLVDSIAGLIGDIHMSTPVKIKFTHDLENDLLSPGKKVTLFRIAQEQLKNILKHSQASEVDIFLQCRDNKVHLSIRDNGIGFETNQTHQGIGLSNIYERTRFYNGVAEIQSSQGKGCLLEVSIPVS